MPRMLRHNTTGEMYPFNRDMAKHPSMEVYDQPDPQFKEAEQEDTAAADVPPLGEEAVTPAQKKALAAKQKKADAALKKKAAERKAAALAASKAAEDAAEASKAQDAADDLDLSGIDLSDA
jgi:hypothetical protein